MTRSIHLVTHFHLLIHNARSSFYGCDGSKPNHTAWTHQRPRALLIIPHSTIPNHTTTLPRDANHIKTKKRRRRNEDMTKKSRKKGNIWVALTTKSTSMHTLFHNILFIAPFSYGFRIVSFVLPDFLTCDDDKAIKKGNNNNNQRTNESIHTWRVLCACSQLHHKSALHFLP